MKKCFICGENARIFVRGKWICRDCYWDIKEESGEKDQSVGIKSPLQETKHINLNLSMI